MRIYKIVTPAQWAAAETTGVFEGAPVDLADGYIHFSTGAQLADTLAKHFAGERELLLVEVDTGPLGDALRWEVSRGGQLFPHLYAALPTSAAERVETIPMSSDGRHDVKPLLGRAEDNGT